MSEDGYVVRSRWDISWGDSFRPKTPWERRWERARDAFAVLRGVKLAKSQREIDNDWRYAFECGKDEARDDYLDQAELEDAGG